MIKLIGETAWHHEGDFEFMRDLIYQLTEKSDVDIIKMHVTLDLDEYMAKDHEAYQMLKKWIFSESQWQTLTDIVSDSSKELMLLANDCKAIEFSANQNISLIELHSVCLNVPMLQNKIIESIPSNVKVAIGVGGSTLEEIDAAISVFQKNKPVLFFGFQNYPTKYHYINLRKINKIQSMYPSLEYGFADHTSWDDAENELVTLMVASNSMNFVEKHVTTCPGEDRCDASAAISIQNVNSLREKLSIVSSIRGSAEIGLNDGEKKYSVYGPMKMACVAAKDIHAGNLLDKDMLAFKRTKATTVLSQIDYQTILGSEVCKDNAKGAVIQVGDLNE